MTEPLQSPPARPGLPSPVSRVLADPVNEASIARVWHRVAARRGARAPRRALALAFAIGVTATVASVSVLHPPWGGGAPSSQGPSASGPLLAKNGVVVAIVRVPAGAPSARLELADGSALVVSPGAELEPLASTALAFVTRVNYGRVLFDVRPRGARTWRVQAGPVEVEVVGTRFSVTRGTDRVRVEVERGAVLVRAPALGRASERLRAGQRLELGLGIESGGELELAPPSPAGSRLLSPAPFSAPSAESPPPAPPPSGALGNRSFPAGAAREATQARPAPAAGDWFALADEARLAGEPDRAIGLLEGVLETGTNDPRRALAAVTLGRLQLGRGRPARAASAFEHALRLGVPSGLEEDVFARLVEAYARSGQHARAERAAAQYSKHYPDGRRRREVEDWLSR